MNLYCKLVNICKASVDFKCYLSIIITIIIIIILRKTLKNRYKRVTTLSRVSVFLIRKCMAVSRAKKYGRNNNVTRITGVAVRLGCTLIDVLRLLIHLFLSLIAAFFFLLL